MYIKIHHNFHANFSVRTILSNCKFGLLSIQAKSKIYKNEHGTQTFDEKMVTNKHSYSAKTCGKTCGQLLSCKYLEFQE